MDFSIYFLPEKVRKWIHRYTQGKVWKSYKQGSLSPSQRYKNKAPQQRRCYMKILDKQQSPNHHP
jgi:hypothetical protein